MPRPSEICHDCGNKYGRTVNGHCATFSPGTCDWCKAETIVTEPRDYGYPKAPKGMSYGTD